MLDLPRGALKNMRVDAAFRLAECTGDLRDLEIAEGWRDSIGTPVQRREGGDKGEMGKRKAKGGSFSGIRWDEGISEWVAATPGTEVRKGKGRVLRSRRGVEVEQQESEEVEESSGSSETETEEESGSGSESDDESDAVSVSGSEMQEEESLTPGTEMSPGPFSDPEINWGKEMEMETKGGSEPEPEPESDSAADPLTDEQQPPPTASSKSSPPPPGGFLAARPRRLSRRLALPGAGDELAIDEVNESEKENWYVFSLSLTIYPPPAASQSLSPSTKMMQWYHLDPHSPSINLGRGRMHVSSRSIIANPLPFLLCLGSVAKNRHVSVSVPPSKTLRAKERAKRG